MHRSRMRVLIAGVLVTLSLLLNVIAPASAQDSPATPAADPSRTSLAFEFFPAETGFGSFFEPTIDAGSTAELTVTLANTGDIAQDLRTYAMNAFTADGGGFAAAEYGTAPDDVTDWLDFPEEVVTLEPGTGIERRFAVTVPEGTAPGQYITALAGEHAVASNVNGSDAFAQKLRYSVPVFITVPGDAAAGFEASDVAIDASTQSLVVSVTLTNTGDVRVRPEGSVDIVDSDDNLAASIPVSMESIYARDETTLVVGAPVRVDAGTYTVQVNLNDPETGETASAESGDVLVDLSATPLPTLITISTISVAPAPAADDVQFANVEAVVTNIGPPVANAQLSLIASVDGAEVERFPISQSLSLPSGDTPVTTRYIPATGWTTGTWTFELLLETVESSGATMVVGRQAIDATITIP